jgi:outer membrane biosynthesis protein TonB
MEERAAEHYESSPAKKAGAVAATTGLIFIGSMGAVGASAINAHEQETESTDTGSHLILAADDRDITAPKADLVHPKVEVKAKPKPKVAVKKDVAKPVAPPKVVAPAPKIIAPAPAPAPKPVVVLPAPKPAPAPAPPKVATPAPVPNGTKAARIAAAALAQLGRMQDCTMLATNALAAVGVSFHDWPAGYLSLGTTVPASAAVPGDLIYYANGGMGLAHIAVYIGNGVAVHGGWNGNQTVTFSANVGSGPVFIRVA